MAALILVSACSSNDGGSDVEEEERGAPATSVQSREAEQTGEWVVEPGASAESGDAVRSAESIVSRLHTAGHESASVLRRSGDSIRVRPGAGPLDQSAIERLMTEEHGFRLFSITSEVPLDRCVEKGASLGPIGQRPWLDSLAQSMRSELSGGGLPKSCFELGRSYLTSEVVEHVDLDDAGTPIQSVSATWSDQGRRAAQRLVNHCRERSDSCGAGAVAIYAGDRLVEPSLISLRPQLDLALRVEELGGEVGHEIAGLFASDLAGPLDATFAG